MMEPPTAYVGIDAALDTYASKAITDGKSAYRWWWNGNDVLAMAIASMCHHMRTDGCTEFTADELVELEKLERYMGRYAEASGNLSQYEGEGRWLHAEAMWLLGDWFDRMWD